MTHTEAAEYMGKVGAISLGGMEFQVRATDARQVWGDTQVLLVPVWGNDDAPHGAAWKSTASVRFT